MTRLTIPRRRLAEGLESARKEIGLVAALAVTVVGLLIFLSMADEVVDGHTKGFDEGLMLMLRHPGDIARPIGPAWLKLAAMDLTAFGSITDLTLIVLAVVGLFVAQRRWREAALLACACGSGLPLVGLMKAVFGRERPPVAMHAVEVGNSSFPSGHAMLSALVYLSLAALLAHFAERRRVRVYALATGLAATLLVGASRVYLGVHWPTDVLAGWALGAAWAMLWWLIAWWVEHRPRSGRPPEALDNTAARGSRPATSRRDR
ncbi:MAG TPA: phosphatase PAP2 family protein [Caulobacteraceae bacterium]|nr:phosphatase PAP2 family protein [Caulobacteraceae bacterium]